jgi:hypothetical protein
MGSGGSRSLWSPSNSVPKAGKRREAQGGSWAPRRALPTPSCPAFFCPGLPARALRLFRKQTGLAAFCLPHGNLYVFSLALASSTVRRRLWFGLFLPFAFCLAPAPPKPIGCYRVKPHGQLVRVSCTHCCASTPRLSTS